MLIVVTAEPLDEAEAARAHVASARQRRGDRVPRLRARPPRGPRVDGVEYQAYRPMAERELRAIAASVAATHGVADVAVLHRTGRLPVGEASLVVAVGAPHRAAAFRCAEEIIDTLKERVPIWKKEIGPAGTAWQEGVTPRSGIRGVEGEAMEERVRVCRACHAIVGWFALFCETCGAKQDPPHGRAGSAPRIRRARQRRRAQAPPGSARATTCRTHLTHLARRDRCALRRPRPVPDAAPAHPQAPRGRRGAARARSRSIKKTLARRARRPARRRRAALSTGSRRAMLRGRAEVGRAAGRLQPRQRDHRGGEPRAHGGRRLRRLSLARREREGRGRVRDAARPVRARRTRASATSAADLARARQEAEQPLPRRSAERGPLPWVLCCDRVALVGWSAYSVFFRYQDDPVTGRRHGRAAAPGARDPV